MQLTQAIQEGPNATSGKDYIFGHNSSRYADSRVLDFLHGSSVQFQNFCRSIKVSTSSLCIYCETEEDSPVHQLFYCYALEDRSRRELLSNVKEPENFTCEIVFSNPHNPGHIHLLLYNRVEFITSINVNPEDSLSDQ